MHGSLTIARSLARVLSRRRPFFMLMLLILFSLLPLRAWPLQTQRVEIGSAAGYDGTVAITRDATGRMIFHDNETGTTTLGAMLFSSQTHGGLLGLGNDDHPQYLNIARHGAAHTADFNSALAVNPDLNANATLGAHLLDQAIHLKRAAAETIAGNWIFTGLPECRAGLRLSNGGVAGNVGLLFATAAQDAQLLWNNTANQFEFNRNLTVNGNATLGTVGCGAITSNGNLTLNGYNPTVHLAKNGATTSYFEMYDNSATQTSINRVSNSGDCLIDWNPKCTDGTGQAYFRFFRDTNTSNANSGLYIYKGDGTSTSYAYIPSRTGAANFGSLLIGGTSVIDSSRNVANVGTVACGAITGASTITGTTLNGTTGLNTGSGAGTQRIDASGNLTAPTVTLTSNVLKASDGATALTTTAATGAVAVAGALSAPSIATTGNNTLGSASGNTTTVNGSLAATGASTAASYSTETHSITVGGQKTGLTQSSATPFLRFTPPASSNGQFVAEIQVMVSAQGSGANGVCQHFTLSLASDVFKDAGGVEGASIVTTNGAKNTNSSGVIDISSSAFTATGRSSAPLKAEVSSNIALSGSSSSAASYTITYTCTMIWSGFSTAPVILGL